MDAVALCADATAGWHAAWLAALGLRSEWRDTTWRALESPPFIYWTAITLTRAASEPDIAGAAGTICDSWSSLDLRPNGFEPVGRGESGDTGGDPWFLRPPAPLPPEDRPRELEVIRVSTPDEVAEFEAVSIRGFGGEDAVLEPGTLHPAPILANPRMTMVVGRVRGAPVAAGTAYRGNGAVGLYGVTTIASARRRGYATTLTGELIDPALPAVLSPSREAERLYRRLGFEQVGELRQWQRVLP